jgi:hypothetical protein
MDQQSLKKHLLGLHESGHPWQADLFNIYVKIGDLEMLQWLHEVGCPWNRSTTAIAVKTGNLEIVEWLREIGCPEDFKRTSKL